MSIDDDMFELEQWEGDIKKSYVWIGTGGRRTRFKYDRATLFGTLNLVLDSKAGWQAIEDAIVFYGKVDPAVANYIASEYIWYLQTIRRRGG